jgi:predicted molibdopterin-dependent oxidoreductase YjgC
VSQPTLSAAADSFLIEVDGETLAAKAGQTVAAALLAAGRLTWNLSHTGEPRGVFCGMGVCYDCLVTVNGMPDSRACMTPAAPGMRVETRVR